LRGFILVILLQPLVSIAATVEAPVFHPSPKPTGRHWLFLTVEELTPTELDRARNDVARSLTPRSLARRRKVIGLDPPVRRCDLPVSRERLRAIEATGCRVVRTLRYLNAVTVEAPPEALARARGLEFIRKVRPVMALPSLHQNTQSVENHHDRNPQPVLPSGRDDPEDYGLTWWQSALVNLPAAHRLGYRGRSILIGVQDAGFNNLDHRCFRHLEVVAAYDFLNGDDNVGDEGDIGNGAHGTRTLSVIAGLDSGRFIGAAPEAHFVLTKTEDSEEEYPVEEDLWVAGLWFHDSLGVDVLSSSVSYRAWYDYEDMDGETAVTTRAADSAAAAGMVIVNSVGNSGRNPYPHSKIGAPADGRLVVGAGGVRPDSSYWTASSRGPTYDGRIKPDVAAQSSAVYTASVLNDTSYFNYSGTSFACPMVAGVAALILEANPWLTPSQVTEILHSTSSRANHPDTLTGYGIINALEAVYRAEAVVTGTKPAPPQTLILTAYPNPFNGRLTIEGVNPRIIEVYDVTGRRVDISRIIRNGSNDRSASLDFSSLPAGKYMLCTDDGNSGAHLGVVLIR